MCAEFVHAAPGEALRRRYLNQSVHHQRCNREHRHGITQSNRVSLENVRRQKWRREPAQSKEQVEVVQKRAALAFVLDEIGQRVRGYYDDAAADSQAE